MAGSVRGRVELNTAKLGRSLKDRNGEVGKIMNAFAGLATVEIKEVGRARTRRRTGEFIDGISSTVVASSEGPAVEVRSEAAHTLFLEDGTRPHVIRPNAAKALRFTSGGAVVYTKRVNHPGTKPLHIFRDGIRRAADRLERI